MSAHVNCPMCESDNLSVKADKHGPQYFVCNDCGYSESAEHAHDDLDEDLDEEVIVKPSKSIKTVKFVKKTAKKSSVKKRGKK